MHTTTGFHFPFTTRDANKLLIALLLFEVCLVLVFMLDALVEMPRPIHRLFDLDRESTIPAWFSAVQLFVIGMLFLFSGQWSRVHRIVRPGFLLVVGMAFIFLSMDEAASIHENITAGLKHVEWIPRFKGDHGIWIQFYILIIVVLAVVGGGTLVSMLSVYPRQSLILFFGLVTLLIGGIGMEIISYWYLRGSELAYLYKIEVALEEFFEMAGASIVLYGTISCALKPLELTTAESEKGDANVLKQN